MGSVLARLAVTILVPLALALAGRHAPLPGVDTEALGGALPPSLGVLALGIQPIVTGYVLVEVIAFMVPRWSRARHAGPAARAPIERAAVIAALLLAATQALAAAFALRALEWSGATGGVAPDVSVPLVAVTLIGGVCVQLVAARLVTQRGLGNGVVVLAAAEALDALVARLAPSGAARGPAGLMGLFGASGVPHDRTKLAAGALALVAACVATWTALRGAGDAAVTARSEGGTPYRGARQLVLTPWIPIPVGSFAPYALATSLLMLPAALASLHVPAAAALSEWLQHGDDAFTLSLAALVALGTFALARVLHRPREMGELAARLGAPADLAREATRLAVRRAIPPSLLFFAALVAAGAAPSLVAPSALVLLVAASMDLARAARTYARAPDLAVAWEERRATALPVIREALAGAGIAAEVRGASILALFQAFAPYAPAEILVRAADAGRAGQVVRELLAGGEPVARGEPVALPAPRAPWSPRTRAALLATCAALGACAMALPRTHLFERPRVASRPVQVEIVRVDDDADPFADLTDDALPVGEGLSLVHERVPLGEGSTAQRRAARLAYRAGEPKSQAIARFRAWLATSPLSQGARFAVEEVSEPDADSQTLRPVGLRSYVLTGDPIVGNRDIADAVVAMDDGPAGPQYYVAVTLSTGAAQRFERATREWTQRRIAIVVDGVVDSAPVVRSAITGGHVSITVGSGDPATQRASAVRLEAALRAPR